MVAKPHNTPALVLRLTEGVYYQGLNIHSNSYANLLSSLHIARPSASNLHCHTVHVNKARNYTRTNSVKGTTN